MSSVINQKKVLSLMLAYKSITIEANRNLAPKMFLSKYAKFFYDNITEHFIKYGSIPTQKMLNNYIKKTFEKEEEIDEYKLFLNKLFDLDVRKKEAKYYMDLVNEEYTKSTAYDILQESVEAMGRSDVNIFGEIEDLQLRLGQLNQTVSPNEIGRQEIVSDLLNRLKLYEKQKDNVVGVPSGIDALDAHTGGWRKSQLTILMGNTGEGKSLILLNWAIAAFIRGYSVIFVTMEMSYEEVMGRLHSHITNIAHDKIWKGEMDHDEERQYYSRLIANTLKKSDRKKFKKWFNAQSIKKLNVEKLYEEVTEQFSFRGNRFFVIDIAKDCTLSNIETEVKQLLRGHTYDALYIDHLNTIEPEKKTASWVRDIGGISRRLKGLAKELTIPIIIPTQMGEVKDEEAIETGDAKYAKAISENADWVIAFKQSDEDKLTGVLNLQFPKTRHAKKATIKVRENFNKMRIENYDGDI